LFFFPSDRTTRTPAASRALRIQYYVHADSLVRNRHDSLQTTYMSIYISIYIYIKDVYRTRNEKNVYIFYNVYMIYIPIYIYISQKRKRIPQMLLYTEWYRSPFRWPFVFTWARIRGDRYREGWLSG